MMRQVHLFQIGKVPRSRHLSLLALCLLGFSLAGPVAAQWKWRGADGRVQYSDRPPPPSIPARDILTRPPGYDKLSVREMDAPRAPASAASASTAPAASAASSPADVRAAQARAEARAREAEAEAAKRKADEEKQAQQRADNCRRARDYARSLESGSRIARVNDKGEREFLDDAQRARELQRSREIMSSDCR